MGKLTLSGIGSFLFGWFGNIAIEVFPMTGYLIPEFWARVIVWFCLATMFGGVILMIAALFKTKNKCDESLTVTNEILRVYKGNLTELDKVATIEIRQERSVKMQIPDKLRDIDEYLAEVVKNQDLNATTLISIANKIFKWYDWFPLLFMVITYTSNLLKRIFKDTHIKYIIRFTTRFNLVLSEYALGTLPTIERDSKYLQIYGELIHLESVHSWSDSGIQAESQRYVSKILRNIYIPNC